MITPDLNFKWLGLISTVILWSGLLFLLYRWPGKRSMSFSLHAAQTKASQIYYFMLFAIVLPLLYLFLIKWYAPTLHLSIIFTSLATFALLGQLIVILFPAIPGRKLRVHNFGAFLTSLLMIPLAFLIAFAHVPLFISVITLMGAVYLLGATILFVTIKRTHAYYLYFQTAHYAVFLGIILLSAYVAR